MHPLPLLFLPILLDSRLVAEIAVPAELRQRPWQTSKMTHEPHFLQFNPFFNKIYVWLQKNLNSSLDLGVSVRIHGAEVTRLGATDLGDEVSGRAP